MNQEPFSCSSPTTARASRRMLLSRRAALPAALGLVALIAPESAETRTARKRRGGINTGDTVGSSSLPEDQERAFLTLINRYRRRKGRGALSRQGQLDAAAERHSLDQADNTFSGHRGSDGSTPDERIEDAGYDWRAWGENVYWNSGDGSASAAFQWWKNSSGHRANMLSANFTEIGIARVRGASGRWYWTTTFGRR